MTCLEQDVLRKEVLDEMTETIQGRAFTSLNMSNEKFALVLILVCFLSLNSRWGRGRRGGERMGGERRRGEGKLVYCQKTILCEKHHNFPLEK